MNHLSKFHAVRHHCIIQLDLLRWLILFTRLKMLQLDDDCLYQIFIKLSLSDQVSVAKACNRFRDVICEMIWRCRFRNVDTINPKLRAIKSTEFQFILEQVDKDVQRLRIAKPIGMLSYRIDLGFYTHLNLSNLIEFECTDVRITDSIIHALSTNCVQLRKLSVQSRKITGQNIPQLQFLETLTVEYCSIDELNLARILSQLHLKYLKIYDNLFNTEPALLSTPSPTLETLVIDNVKACGMQLVEYLQLQTLHYEATFTDCDEDVTKIRMDTKFERLSDRLLSLDVGVIFYALACLVDFLPETTMAEDVPETEEEEEFAFTSALIILKPILRLMNFCQRLGCIKFCNYFQFNIDDFEYFIGELKKRQRSLRLVFGYTKPTELVTRLEKWFRDPTSAYNKQDLLTIDVEYIPPEKEQDLNLIKYECLT